jgi:hypothetical protein
MHSGKCSRCKGDFTKDNCGPKTLLSGEGYCSPCAKERWRAKVGFPRYGLAKGLCGNKSCRKILTEENSSPSALKQSGGWCKECTRDRVKEYSRTLSGRHCCVKRDLSREGVSRDDLLWHFNFYCEIIKDDSCHYCGGSLNPTSHALDRVDSSKGHTCCNVVPCCWRCNNMKSDDISYEEMMLLAPVLQEIRLRRESRKQEI